MSFVRHMIGGALVTGSFCYSLARYMDNTTVLLSSNIQMLSQRLGNLHEPSLDLQSPDPESDSLERRQLSKNIQSRWNELLISTVDRVQRFELAKAFETTRGAIGRLGSEDNTK